MSLLLFISSFIGADMDRLGSERWDLREAAHGRLKSYGLGAVPEMLRGAVGDSPEVRHRCLELLAPWRRAVSKWDAISALAGPTPPEAATFYKDEQLRRLVYRLAVRAGCDPTNAEPLLPEKVWRFPLFWFPELVPEAMCLDALNTCRKTIADIGSRP